MSQAKRRVLIVVMDGVGEREQEFGNAVKLAKTPHLDKLRTRALFTTLAAHGSAVGLPSDSDIGNSEVGHNALGAGRVFAQGSQLVQNALNDGSLFKGEVWRKLVDSVRNHEGSLHFIGLLSDGNVHSHVSHLFKLMHQAVDEGLSCIRIHALLDGRDVGEKTAEIYADRLNEVINTLNAGGADVKVASGGGRMKITMDRYGADWPMVERGWKAHVLGEAEHHFSSLEEAIAHFRKSLNVGDQFFPGFVIEENGQPVGQIKDGDGVIFFNFRGDRAIEICQAFENERFDKFDRQRVPKVFFAGMMEYDGDLHIPKNYLVSPPTITDTLGEYLANLGLRQFACSETQKYGHVTYFWNGNRSGKFNEALEEYVEIPSDNFPFEEKPEMKAREITDVTIDRMTQKSFDLGRINYANGDMVGHTGHFKAAVSAMESVDAMIGRLIAAAEQTGTILIVTADHGNCDDMFEKGETEDDFPNWRNLEPPLPKPKTSHTLSPVPCYIFDPEGGWQLAGINHPGLANIANTALVLMGLKPRSNYLEPLVKRVEQ